MVEHAYGGVPPRWAGLILFAILQIFVTENGLPFFMRARFPVRIQVDQIRSEVSVFALELYGALQEAGMIRPECNSPRSAFQNAPGDDTRLNFGRALKDVEDAAVAEDAADGVFEGKAIAAVDLQGVIRR